MSNAVAKRYARAVAAALEEKGGKVALEEISQGLQGFANALQQSDALRELLANPSFLNERKDALQAVLKKLGLPKLAAEMVQYVVERGRINVLGAIAAEVQAIADEKAGRLRAQVTSAIPLSAAQMQRLTRALEKRLGHAVAVDVNIDPEILGGLLCKVGDLTLDSTVRHQFELMRERLDVRAS